MYTITLYMTPSDLSNYIRERLSEEDKERFKDFDWMPIRLGINNHSLDAEMTLIPTPKSVTDSRIFRQKADNDSFRIEYEPPKINCEELEKTDVIMSSVESFKSHVAEPGDWGDDPIIDEDDEINW